MANIPTSIYITHLEREGSFIKIWGQTDRALPLAIEKALQQMTPHFEQGMYSPAIENFQVGIMCCAKFKDELYYRARITNISYLTQGMVEVLFIDYGNRDVISCMNTRTMSGLQAGLISIPAQAKDFILGHVTLPNWDNNWSNFEMICSELRYLEFQLVPILEIGPYTLISLFLNKQNIIDALVDRGLLLKIPIQFQQATLQPLITRNTPPGLTINTHQLPVAMPVMQPKMAPVAPTVPTPTLLTYKALPLDNESEHQIYVSYVSDGPCLFSVQLKRMEEQLKRLMTEINCMELQLLEEYPLPGTVCLAQSSEDGYICRAVVTSMVDGEYKVFYVDFGNTELLQFDKLYQIPFKYVIPKVMATRFALAGLENSTVSMEMKCKFKEFVNNKPLFMRVKPAATKSALPLCELWDDSGVKALDMIKQAALLSYPEPAPLNRGVNQEVKVSYVYSCNKIFVQLKVKENELKQLMTSLQETCFSRPLFNVKDLKIGAPCCSIFPDDSMWYRGEILEINGDSFKIKYVDFGNENVVGYNDIKVPLPEHITALRPQAIECCLNGYQNFEPDEQRDILLEELILEQELSMRIVEIQSNRALVDLYDKQHYNVASLLLEKIASTTSTVSPLLIQDNHRIEHRKRSPPQRNQKDFREKRPLRELNDRNRDNRQENWRQNSFSRSNDDNWNEQPQTEKQDRFQKTNNRNDETEWNSPETSENKTYGNKRFDDQRGGSRRNNPEQTNNNDDWGAKDNENRNFHPRGGGGGGKRNDFDGKGGFNRRDDGFEKRDGFQRRDGFKRKDDFERRDGFEKGDGFDRRGKRDGFEKRDDFERRDGFHKRGDGFGKRDDFERRDGFGKRDDFERKDGFKKFNRNQSGEERKFDSYGKGNRNFNDNRSGDEGFVKHKGRDFKKDGSEKSWSDTSERSWKKGPKSFDKPRGGDKFGSSRKGFAPPSANNEATLQTEDWGADAAPSNDTNATYDYATETDQFEIYSDLSGTTEAISISWFYNPINFYCQLDKNKIEFKEMMEEIQQNYRNRPSGKLNPGSAAVVPFSEDGALYRAEIISSQFNQYHVRYVDYGNVATVNKVYPIEKKYMKIPAQAIPCGLGGVAPCGENWPDPDTFSSYFDKDNFECRFDSFLEDRYCVRLNHDGKSISDLLNEASLTISTQATVNIDINLLINQQIMIVLRNVASLSDITVEIESGTTVMTSMHNLASATETYEDNLKQWMGHYLIMYVDSVLEDRLEITLYDLTGQKLQIINPDEGAYDNVEPLCPLPIYSNIIEGWVSHASAESIYIQPSKFADVIAQLLESLYEHYSAVTQEEAVTAEEGQMFAVLSSDSNWYRANVTEVKGDAAVVTFVDYGNSELVPFENLRELSPQFYQPHMLAVEILIPGDKEQYLEQEIAVSVAYGSLGWEGEVLADNDAGGPEIAIPQSALPETKSPQFGIESQTIQEELPHEEAAISSPIGFNVIISHIDTPNEFYLQQSEAAESIALLQEELQEQIPNLPNLDNPTAGVLCAAPYFNQWFRALVLDADEDITTVRFVDVGNTDVITNSSAHVKTLPTEMLSIEYHAKLCSLFVKPTGEEWSSAAQDSFLRYKTMENLTAEIVHQDEKTTYVELYADGQNVAEILKRNGLAADLQLETESSSTGFISHLNSPSEFWIQLESSCSDLEWVADQLANAESYPALEDLTPGSLCAAIFSDDDSWYRARILSNTVAGLEVIFIDYGNSCSCNGLRELPEDLIMLPPLALKCSLQKPNGIMQWSQAATDKFKEISADGATVFNVNILTPGETSIVQLTYEDQDVSTQLVPETRQCFVSHVDSVENFWVQFMDDNAKIENLTEAMESADSWPSISQAETGDLVAALFEDELWYRARILEKIQGEYQVLFIDYGNTTGVTVLKELPEECAKLEALATNFKLDMLPRTKWGDKSDELFTSMTECGVAMFDLEVVAENTARLYLNGLDVRSSLDCVKCTPSVSLQSSPKKIQAETNTQQIIAEDVEEGGTDVIQTGVDENVEEDDEIQTRNSKTEAAEIIGSHLDKIIETVVDSSQNIVRSPETTPKTDLSRTESPQKDAIETDEKEVSQVEEPITPRSDPSPAESPKKKSSITPNSTPTGSPKKFPEKDVRRDDGLITPESGSSPVESPKKISLGNEPITPNSTPTGSPKKSPGKDVSGEDDGLITPKSDSSPAESPNKNCSENEPITPNSTPTGSPKKSPGKDVSGGDDGLITPKSDSSPAESPYKNCSENEPITPNRTPAGSPKKSPGKDVSGDDGLITPKSDSCPAESPKKKSSITPNSTPTGSPKKSPVKDVSGDDGLIRPETTSSPAESPKKSSEKDVDETIENVPNIPPKDSLKKSREKCTVEGEDETSEFKSVPEIPKCDTTNQELCAEEVTTECDKTVDVITNKGEKEEEETCSKDSIAITKDNNSETGHSPKKDERVFEGIPDERNESKTQEK